MFIQSRIATFRSPLLRVAVHRINMDALDRPLHAAPFHCKLYTETQTDIYNEIHQSAIQQGLDLVEREKIQRLKAKDTEPVMPKQGQSKQVTKKAAKPPSSPKPDKPAAAAAMKQPKNKQAKKRVKTAQVDLAPDSQR